jgi:hypothetical protein
MRMILSPRADGRRPALTKRTGNDTQPPYNGLPFSCRERAAETRQTATDSRAQSGDWNTVLDGEGWT